MHMHNKVNNQICCIYKIIKCQKLCTSDNTSNIKIKQVTYVTLLILTFSKPISCIEIFLNQIKQHFLFQWAGWYILYS